MKSLEQIDRWIAGKVKTWTTKASGGPQPPALLEVRRDILEDLRDRIEPVGGGRSVFPYNTVTIRVNAPDQAAVDLYEAAFQDTDRAARELLSQANCPPPDGFNVEVSIATDGDRPYEIAYSNRMPAAAAPPAPKPQRPNAILTVVRGEAEETTYPIASDRINIGRLREVTSEKGGLRRRNDIAFKDSETTVSREHAYIRWDNSTGHFRLYDSGSQRGASIFREGRRIDVPRGAARGIQLQSGDEIHLGEARVRFDIS